MLGGLLWVLFPLGELPAAHLVLTPEGYLATYALGFLWAQLLLLMGLRGLHAIHRGGYGWLGTVGFYVSLIALVLTLVGGAFAMTNITFTGAGSTVAYLILITGFLPLGWGSVLLGLTITMVMRDLLSHLTGVLLAIGVPLGLLVAFVAGTTWDFYFWAGLTMPYGLAWLLLGYALLPGRGSIGQKPSLVR
jgi:hypothetical protein